jgi:hypothetical protein
MHIVKEIQACIQLIPEVKFKKVRTEYNAVVHELTQLAKRTTHYAVWRGSSAPSCILA